MRRIHRLQQWFSPTDPARLEVLIEVPSSHRLSGNCFAYRRLVEEQGLAEPSFQAVSRFLTTGGLSMR
jgi:hypothetical protein